MEGICFVVDENGRKIAVQIDLARWGALWEDIHDQLVASSREDEKSIPFEMASSKRAARRRSTRREKGPSRREAPRSPRNQQTEDD